MIVSHLRQFIFNLHAINSAVYKIMFVMRLNVSIAYYHKARGI